jgi:hypothetical protein
VERAVRLEPGETKNNEARTIPLVADLYEVLKLQREIRDQYFPESPWVFSRAGEPCPQFPQRLGISLQDGGPCRRGRQTGEAIP